MLAPSLNDFCVARRYSAAATARDLAATSLRLRAPVSSRANRGAPAATIWFGLTKKRATTPSCGAAISLASLPMISAGASTVRRMGMSATSAAASHRRLGLACSRATLWRQPDGRARQAHKACP